MHSNRHCPFFRCFFWCEVNRFDNGLISWKGEFIFSVFSNLPIQIFVQVGSINDFSDFNGVIEESGEFIPVILPSFNGVEVFGIPSSFKILKSSPSGLFGRSRVDFLYILCKSFSILPNHIPESVSDLMNEHIFGTIKRQWGYNHTNLRGLTKVNGEMALIRTVYNIKRAINILGIEKLLAKLKTWKPNYPKATMPQQKRLILGNFDTLYFSNLVGAA